MGRRSREKVDKAWDRHRGCARRHQTSNTTAAHCREHRPRPPHPSAQTTSRPPDASWTECRGGGHSQQPTAPAGGCAAAHQWCGLSSTADRQWVPSRNSALGDTAAGGEGGGWGAAGPCRRRAPQSGRVADVGPAAAASDSRLTPPDVPRFCLGRKYKQGACTRTDDGRSMCASCQGTSEDAHFVLYTNTGANRRVS